MEWTLEGLKSFGFTGFVTFAELPTSEVPLGAGVYVAVRPTDAEPEFTTASVAGWFKGKDPSLPTGTLNDSWVDGAAVIYIGKASTGSSGRRGLKKRLDEYRRIGAGEPVGHWGGRMIWPLEDSSSFLVAWKETPDEDPEDVEAQLIDGFIARFGKMPFANRKLGRRPATISKLSL